MMRSPIGPSRNATNVGPAVSRVALVRAWTRSSQRSRWQQMLGGGSNVARVIREAGALGVDVHVIALRKTPPAAPSGSLSQNSAERPSLVRVSKPEESSPPSGTG